MAYTREALDIDAENSRRLAEIFKPRNQFTGLNVPFHTKHVVIKDMGELKDMWLTDEVYNNGLYQAVLKAGSIESYVKEINEGQFDELAFDEVLNALIDARLKRDPAFAFYMGFQIVYKQGGVGPFKMNYAQFKLLEVCESMRMARVPIRIVLLKARQWGGSTFVQLYMAWMQIFVREQWNAVVIAQVKDIARTIKGMYTRVLDSMPGVLLGADKIKFSHANDAGSKFFIANGRGEMLRDNTITVGSYENYEALRGENYAMAHNSEVAYWKRTQEKSPDDVYTNIIGGIDPLPDTLVITESTARGNSGTFYEMYQDAKNPDIETLTKALFVPFYWLEKDMIKFKDKRERMRFIQWMIDNKDNDIAPDKHHEPGTYIYGLWVKGASLEAINWYITKRSDFTDHAQMAREAPSDDIECFVYSGFKVFSPEVVEERRATYVKHHAFQGDIIRTATGFKLQKDFRGRLRIWHHPDQLRVKHRFLVVVDPGGKGPNSDPNVITVIDRMPLLYGGRQEVVARWHGHIRYDQLAYKAVEIAEYYNNALLVFESNTYDKKKAQAGEFVEQGDHIRGILNTIKYKNLYMRPATDPEDIRNGILTKVGFNTNVKTKQDMVDLFTVMFEDDRFIDPDERFYVEAGIYEQREDGSYGNIEGKNNHDDIVMTDMIGCLVSSRMPRPEVEQVYTPTRRVGTRNESDFG